MVESALNAMHGRLHDRPETWAQHIEGSYAPAAVIRRSPGAADTPAAYPYAHTAWLNDITSGSNAKGGGGLLGLGGGNKCSTYLCTAGPGYDGPTGLGTPNGVGAF